MRTVMMIAAILSAGVSVGALAQARSGQTGTGTRGAAAMLPTLPSPFGSPWATIPFDGRIRRSRSVSAPGASASATADARLGTRLDQRMGSRAGSAWSARLGGGSTAPLPSQDPRDRLESRLETYDRAH